METTQLNRTEDPTAKVPSKRLDRLVGIVSSSGPVHLRDAAKTLGVSEMTVRRDLAATTLLTCLGGYVALTNATGMATGYALALEEKAHMAGKRAAAEAAAQRVQPGETIFIDCGTTMPFLAAALAPDMPLTIVCFALNIAAIICKRPKTRTILLGGFYYESSASFWSRESEAALSRMGINRTFISAGGIHLERGASCSGFHEVPLKQIAMSRAEENCLVADATKFDQIKPACFAELSGFDRIITDGSMPPDVRQRFNKLRPKLEII